MTTLASFGTATIHEAMGKEGALPSSIRPLALGLRIFGPAFPVRSPGGDNLMLHRAIAKAPTGAVIVADADFCCEAGPWGDLMTFAAMKAGIAGLVISGAVRDSAEILQMGFPVFCIGRCIRGTSKKYEGPVPDTIVIGDVTIRPGDMIIGDDDGVVVVPAERVEETIAACRAREEREAEFRRRMAEGETLQSLVGRG